MSLNDEIFQCLEYFWRSWTIRIEKQGTNSKTIKSNGIRKELKILVAKTQISGNGNLYLELINNCQEP